MPLSYIALRHEIWAGENLIFFFLGSFLTGSTSEPDEVENESLVLTSILQHASASFPREKGAGSFPNVHYVLLANQLSLMQPSLTLVVWCAATEETATKQLSGHFALC